ncbi:MAG TPA: hypothetical protein VF272_00610, partial [Candidatus Saccharimonadia bacterium]
EHPEPSPEELIIDGLAETVEPKETAFFSVIGRELGLTPEETATLEGRLSERPGFLVDLYAEQQYLATHVGETIPSRQDLTKYQPEIQAWLNDSERSNRESRIHGPAHFMRVLIDTKLLSCLIEPQLPAKLSELSVKDVPEAYDHMVSTIDHEALAAFAIGHDWARHDDESEDPDHGARAAESLEDPNVFPDLEDASRILAQALMTGHSREDEPTDVALEDRVARDADLLDRHRDYEGPDPQFIRLHATARIDAVAFTLAVMSDFLIEQKQEDQVEAVLKTAGALGIVKPEEARR